MNQRRLSCMESSGAQNDATRRESGPLTNDSSGDTRKRVLAQEYVSAHTMVMELAIVLSALLATSAALFAHARCRNRRVIHARMVRALRLHINRDSQNIRTER
jgi:hypothetical protein